MAGQVRTVEQVIARLASRSHGVVTRQRLLSAGLTPDQIADRVACGLLIPVHRGVYRVGHAAASVDARYMAAVLACGPGAGLHGLAAAHLFSLIRGSEPSPEVVARTERRVKGVRTIRCRTLRPEDVTRFRGIPVTTVPRTLCDLAARLPTASLGRACHEADVRYGTTPEQVEAVLERRPRIAGRARLRRVLYGDEPISLSRLEARFHELLREAGLPLPATNTKVDRRRLDCRWDIPRLTVELDGYRYHRTRHAWEQDRRREREARAWGRLPPLHVG